MNPPTTTWVTEPPIVTATPSAPTPRHEHGIWMPWLGRNRLVTPAEEAEFVDQLAARAGVVRATVRRTDVTAVLNALRCGLTVGELFERAPGLCPARLYAAYCELERRRFDASLAWTSIAIAGRIDVFTEHRTEAAKLVPALVARLDEVVVETPDEFDLVLLQLAAAVASTNAAARRIERVIEASPLDSDRSIELGRVLYNHAGAGVTSRPDFLAHRVGTLVPTRRGAARGVDVGHRQLHTGPPAMTDLVDPVRPPVAPLHRLEPVVFAHARVAMLTATTDGVVVEANAAAVELFGRPRYALVQEPVAHHLAMLSGLPLADCLREASHSTEALSFGHCAVRRRSADAVMMELTVSSGCQVSGRDLLLLQLTPGFPVG